MVSKFKPSEIYLVVSSKNVANTSKRKKEIKRMRVCQYGVHKDESCPNTVHEQEDYCAEHLSYLTDLNSRATIDDIIVEYLGIDHSKLKNQASIVRDLGADSLEIIEILMSFEEEFEVEIADKAADSFKCLDDVKKFVFSGLMAESRYRTTRHAIHYPSILKRVHENRKNIARKAKAVFDSTYYRNILSDFNLDSEKLGQVAATHLYDGWIKYHTAVPDRSSVKKRKPKYHILFLTWRGVFHIELSAGSFQVQLFSFDELSMRWTYKCDEDGAVEDIELAVKTPDISKSGSNSYSTEVFCFTGSHVERGEKFLNEYNILSGKKI